MRAAIGYDPIRLTEIYILDQRLGHTVRGPQFSSAIGRPVEEKHPTANLGFAEKAAAIGSNAISPGGFRAGRGKLEDSDFFLATADATLRRKVDVVSEPEEPAGKIGRDRPQDRVPCFVPSEE